VPFPRQISALTNQGTLRHTRAQVPLQHFHLLPKSDYFVGFYGVAVSPLVSVRLLFVYFFDPVKLVSSGFIR